MPLEFEVKTELSLKLKALHFFLVEIEFIL